MWVRILEPVVAGRKPRAVGTVLDLPRAEARELIRVKCALECAAPPAVPTETGAAAPVETAEARPPAEQAVSRKRGAK